MRALRRFMRRHPRLRRFVSLGGLALLAFVIQLAVLVSTVWADDCERDWRRAEDCLRSPGFAQGIGTIVSTSVTIAVNGASVGTTVFGGDGGDDGGGGGGDDNGEKKQRRYQLDIRTEDNLTELYADGEDSLYLYARVLCNDPDVDAAALTDSIGFAVEGPNADWLILDAVESTDGFKAVPLRAWPPSETAELLDGGPAVRVSVVLDGHPVSQAVQFDLIPSLYDLEIF